MNKRIDFQTILGVDGTPAFVVLAYDEFVRHFEAVGDLIPDAVAQLVFNENMTSAKAWRTHLGLTQQVVADRLGITQGAYAQLEASGRPRRSSRERIAKALGIRPGQLNF
ncbi:helix-turn-helix transcriptional regulator [Roseateles sp.]|uniref:helix-turn-helix domain-containing protein n=1 Tax=Roseateles sp. TaxID=1971397 RepID=UPI0031DD7C4E